MNVAFDPANHAYTVDGKRWPSVTQLLREFQLVDDTWFTPEAAERGTFVAKAVALDIANNLDESTLDDELRGYVEAARRFRHETAFLVRGCEEVVSCPAYKFAGRIDLRGFFAGAAFLRPALLDMKTGAFAPWMHIQTALYAMCFPTPHETGIVLLRDDGTYRLHMDPAPQAAREVARAVATLSLWKRSHGA